MQNARRNIISIRVLIVSLFLAGVLNSLSALDCAAQGPSQPRRQYIVEFSGDRLPDNLAARIAALGGVVLARLPEINVVIVGSITASAAADLRMQSDVADVTDDDLTPAAAPLPRPAGSYLHRAMSSTSSTQPGTALYLPRQWNMSAVRAESAWNAGLTGNPNVRIAIIDTGIDPTHPDLAGRIDFSRSVSFCPGEDAVVAEQFPGHPSWTDLNGHGTFVASIAASNGHIVAGVTSQTTLMALKWDGIVPCGLSAILRSVIYAANNGADVINMSLTRNIPYPKAGQKGIFHYSNLVVRYALQKGVSAVVVAAGNLSQDLDHNGNEYKFLCDAPGAICVSATGPLDAGPDYLGPFIAVDTPAFYTTFGTSAIDVAAPGGNLNFDVQGNIIGEGWVWAACATTDREVAPNGAIVPGYCSRNGFLAGPWLGTSFAAPHVAGLAGLIVSRIGRGREAQVRAIIENSADDLGQPGADPFYGRGRINVAHALGLP